MLHFHDGRFSSVVSLSDYALWHGFEPMSRRASAAALSAGGLGLAAAGIASVGSLLSVQTGAGVLKNTNLARPG
ncbi:hypothetical protein [Streptomyces sp. NPDC047990]|uniref:hypothetical protein n=1 Tax=Streptomyces sp. NPDC047990 TaxID=3365496 RepID=UPI003721DB65